MKKLLAGIGLFGIALLGAVTMSRAGTPVDTYFSGQFPFSNTTVVGSTQTTVGTANLRISIAPTTGSQGSACRTCFTKFFVQIPTTTILNVLDAATTSYVIDGAGIGTTGTNTVQVNEDHLGPLCLTAGNTVTLNSVATSGNAINHQSFSWEGYTQCGGANNAGN